MAAEVVQADASDVSAGRFEGPTLDAVVAVLSALMVAGVAWDFRRHAEGIRFAEEGFFTLQHVFFYSMFLGIALVIGAATVLNRRAGADWIEAVPPGYRWGVVGVLVFGLGGVGDFFWHSAFGFETGWEAIVSPSHTALGVGAVLFLASPLRAAWFRDREPGGVDVLASVLSLALLLSIVSLFLTYLNPIIRPVGTLGLGPATGVALAMFVAFPLVFLGAALAVTGRFALPPGAFTVAFGVPALVSTVPIGHHEFALVGLVAGLVADGLAGWRRPLPADTVAIRLFGFLVPASFTASYIGIVAATAALAWSVHVWTGVIVLSGFAGLLLTYVVAPPAVPATVDPEMAS